MSILVLSTYACDNSTTKHLSQRTRLLSPSTIRTRTLALFCLWCRGESWITQSATSIEEKSKETAISTHTTQSYRLQCNTSAVVHYSHTQMCVDGGRSDADTEDPSPSPAIRESCDDRSKAPPRSSPFSIPIDWRVHRRPIEGKQGQVTRVIGRVEGPLAVETLLAAFALQTNGPRRTAAPLTSRFRSRWMTPSAHGACCSSSHTYASTNTHTNAHNPKKRKHGGVQVPGGAVAEEAG